MTIEPGIVGRERNVLSLQPHHTRMQDMAKLRGKQRAKLPAGKAEFDRINRKADKVLKGKD